MVCIATIAAHDSHRLQRMGLRRALLMRRANLGDCVDAPSVLRRIASPGYMRYPYSVVPLPWRSLGQVSAADLALQVSRQAVGGMQELDPSDVGALIFCHAAPDERIGHSVPSRLQFELGLRRALPFSVSQAHNTALVIALDLAIGLIEGPEAASAVLLVASDKLLFGAPPHVAADMVWGDVAAAAVLTREAEAGWRVVHVLPRHFDTPQRAHQAWPAADRRAFADYGAQVLRSCLAEADVAAAELAAVVCTSAGGDFAQQVHRAAGLADVAGAAPCEPLRRRGGSARAAGLRATHAASADFLVRLGQIEPHTEPGRPVLAWCHGDNGEFACALLTRIAGARRPEVSQ